MTPFKGYATPRWPSDTSSLVSTRFWGSGWPISSHGCSAHRLVIFCRSQPSMAALALAQLSPAPCF